MTPREQAISKVVEDLYDQLCIRAAQNSHQFLLENNGLDLFLYPIRPAYPGDKFLRLKGHMNASNRIFFEFFECSYVFNPDGGFAKNGKTLNTGHWKAHETQQNLTDTIKRFKAEQPLDVSRYQGDEITRMVAARRDDAQRNIKKVTELENALQSKVHLRQQTQEKNKQAQQREEDLQIDLYRKAARRIYNAFKPFAEQHGFPWKLENDDQRLTLGKKLIYPVGTQRATLDFSYNKFKKIIEIDFKREKYESYFTRRQISNSDSRIPSHEGTIPILKKHWSNLEEEKWSENEALNNLKKILVKMIEEKPGFHPITNIPVTRLAIIFGLALFTKSCHDFLFEVPKNKQTGQLDPPQIELTLER